MSFRRIRCEPFLLLIAISLLACWTPGCQRVTDEKNAPAESTRVKAVDKPEKIDRLPNEPDDLSPNLPTEVTELLQKHFPDYKLPLDEHPTEPKPASKTIATSKKYVKISDKPLAEAIYNNEIDRALRLIQLGGHNNDVHNGYSMLHLAALHGQTDACEQLVDAGLRIDRMHDPEYGPGRTPLQFAIQAGKVQCAKRLLARGAMITPAFSGRPYGSPTIPLALLAIKSGNPAMLQLLIDQGEPFDDQSQLVNAIREVNSPENRLRIVKILLGEGVEPDLQDSRSDPFVAAIKTGDLQLLQLLEDNFPFDYSEPHVRAAVTSNNVNILRYVLSKHARVPAHPQVGQELMRFALVDFRSPELVDLAANAGEAKKYCEQNPACTSYCRRSDFAHPLYHAVMENDLSFCRYLIREFSSDSGLWESLKHVPYEYENDIKFFQQGNTILFSAVFEDNAEALNLLLKYTQRPRQNPVVDINAQNWCGNTVLHEAVNYGSARCVQLLLATGADPTIARLDGCTPLHIAMQHDLLPHHHSEREMFEQTSKILPMLACAAMASGNENWIHATDKDGETVLHRHARAGYPANCRMLIDLGADANVPDKHGRTPLYHALYGTHKHLKPEEKERHIETCFVLLDNVPELGQESLSDYQGYAGSAASRGLYQIFDAILDKGVRLDLPSSAGGLLCSAARFGRQDRVQQLLDWGADINAQGGGGSTALHHAARIKHHELCKFLIANGADVNARDRLRQTPLFELFDGWARDPTEFQSAETRDTAFPVLQLLLQNGANVNAKANSTTSTTFSGTVLEVFKNMPREFRHEIEKARPDQSHLCNKTATCVACTTSVIFGKLDVIKIANTVLRFPIETET